MGYSRETLAAFSDALSAMYAASTPAAALQDCLPFLSRMLGARHMFVDELPHDGSPPRPLASLHMDEYAGVVDRYPVFAHEHPGVAFVRSGGRAPAFRIRDFASTREFEQTGFYCEIFRPMGVRDQICLAVHLERSGIGLTFNRDQSFTEDEAYLAALLQPHVATVVQGSRRSQAPISSPQWQLPVAPDGTVAGVSSELSRLFVRYFSGERTNACGLPDSVKRWVVRRLNDLGGLAAGACALQSWAVAAPCGRLLLQLAPAVGREGAVMRIAEERGTADFLRLRAAGLTTRECEVVFWISQGKRDAEIAVLLDCAPKTVSKHVEHLLAKLGTETRLAAAHNALEWLRRHTSHA